MMTMGMGIWREGRQRLWWVSKWAMSEKHLLSLSFADLISKMFWCCCCWRSLLFCAASWVDYPPTNAYITYHPPMHNAMRLSEFWIKRVQVEPVLLICWYDWDAVINRAPLPESLLSACFAGSNRTVVLITTKKRVCAVHWLIQVKWPIFN